MTGDAVACLNTALEGRYAIEHDTPLLMQHEVYGRPEPTA